MNRRFDFDVSRRRTDCYHADGSGRLNVVQKIL